MTLKASDFPGQPYQHLTNQAGHAYLVGGPLAIMAAPWTGLILAPVIIAAVYLVIWEILVQHGRLWRDSFEDTIHVLCGAAVLCSALSGDFLAVSLTMTAQWVLLAVGVWRRS
jgi:hypothetical protein